jgi:hypothetical protein
VLICGFRILKKIGFAICCLALFINLQIWDAEKTQEFADLRFTDKLKDLRAHL